MGIEELNSGALRKIYIVPHSHHDYAWVYERDWHIRRYIRLFEEVVEWLDANPDATWHIDNVVHSLLPFEVNSPEYFKRFRKYVDDGRIEISNGGYSLARPSYVGEETFIRNLRAGSDYFLEHLGTRGNGLYANIDTASGQRQLPQILNLMGLKYYIFYRPLYTLDKLGVPRQFRWRAPDGSSLSVSRSMTVGMFAQDYTLLDYNTEWDKAREQFWNEELSHRRPDGLIGSDLEYLPCGSDDCRPGVNVYDRKTKLTEFIAEWNKREKTKLTFGVPSEFFGELEKCELPEWDDELDEYELTYNLPAKGEGSMWRQRLEIDRALVQLETLCLIAAQAGIEYPAREIREMWYGLFEITGHAIDFIMKHDDESLMNIALAAKFKAKTMQEEYMRRLARAVEYRDGMLWCAVNTLPYRRTEQVRLFVTPIDGLKPFELYDGEGHNVPYQVLRVNSHFDTPKECRRYDYTAAEVIAEVSLPACGVASIFMRYTGEEFIPSPFEKTASNEITITNGIVTLSFDGGKLVRAIADGKEMTAPEGGSLMKLVCRNHESYKSWVYEHKLTGDDDFVCTAMTLLEQGELRSRVRLDGYFNDRQKASVTLSLLKGERKADIDVKLDCEPDNCTYSFGFACDDGAGVHSDHYFGAGKRERYPFINVFCEAHIEGQLYGRNWASFECGGVPAALISGNCSVYYVHDKAAGFMELFLVRNCTYNDSVEHWTTNLPDAFGLHGDVDFSFALDFPTASDSYKELRDTADKMHYLALVSVKLNKSGDMPLPYSAIENCSSAVITAAYIVNGKYFIRMYEPEGKSADVKLRLGFDIKSAASVDLLDNPLGDEIIVNGRELSFTVKPYKIITLCLEI